MVTDNKRKLLYNEEDIFYDTLPLILEKGKIVVRRRNSTEKIILTIPPTAPRLPPANL